MQNIGGVPRAEVVQAYVSVPLGGEAVEAKRLVGFARTQVLKPGQTQKLVLSFPVDYLTVYRESRSSYFLKKGEYVLWIGNSSAQDSGGRHPSEQFAASAVIAISEEILTEQCTPVCPLQNSPDLLSTGENERERAENMRRQDPLLKRLCLDTSCLAAKRHRYLTPDAGKDPLVPSLSEEQLIRIVVGGGTHGEDSCVLAPGASGTTTGSLYQELGIPNIILSDGPQGLNLSPQIVELPDGSYRAARVPEVLQVYDRYLSGAAGAALKSRMADPSAGIVHYQYATAWPCSQLLAQSWDLPLVEAVVTESGEKWRNSVSRSGWARE